MGKVIYGHVEKLSDISKINREIRKNMKDIAKKGKLTQGVLTQFVKQSRYLVTLTYSPMWQKHLKKINVKVSDARRLAKQEYCKTSQLANKLALKHGLEPLYAENVKYCRVR